MNPDILASIFLIICFTCALILGVERFVRPGPYNLWERAIYLPVYVVCRILWRVHLAFDPYYTVPSGASTTLVEHLSTGAVLVANHCSSMDPMFIQLCAGKRVHWMVAAEYFPAPVIGNILRTYEAIPTRRGGVDTASTKQAIALARSGKWVGMFPEGRINRTEQPLLAVRPGAALVALRARVPLVPIWIEGAPIGPSIFSALFLPANVCVRVGAPDDWGLNEAAQAGSESDRSIAEKWIGRVMQASVASSGRSLESISMAGSHWVLPGQ